MPTPHLPRLGHALRALLHERRHAALGTLDAAGAPFVSMVPFAVDATAGRLVLHVSGLAAPGGRLYETRRALIESCAASPHLSLVAPAGALYGFPAVVGDAARGFDDHAFALEMLETEDVLLVPGSSFNVPYRNHFRVTLLPEASVLREVFARIDRVLERRAVTATGQRAAVA